MVILTHFAALFVGFWLGIFVAMFAVISKKSDHSFQDETLDNSVTTVKTDHLNK